jgi:hypothetical protein
MICGRIDTSSAETGSPTMRRVAARLFASALTACIMTQLRAFSRRLDIPLTTIAINTRLHWQAEQRGNAPYESEPVAFTMDIELRGGASTAEKQHGASKMRDRISAYLGSRSGDRLRRKREAAVLAAA